MDDVIYYIYRESDKRYMTYTSIQPEGSNYTEIKPPQFNAEFEFPYWNEETQSWDIIQHH